MEQKDRVQIEMQCNVTAAPVRKTNIRHLEHKNWPCPAGAEVSNIKHCECRSFATKRPGKKVVGSNPGCARGLCAVCIFSSCLRGFLWVQTQAVIAWMWVRTIVHLVTGWRPFHSVPRLLPYETPLWSVRVQTSHLKPDGAEVMWLSCPSWCTSGGVY